MSTGTQKKTREEKRDAIWDFFDTIECIFTFDDELDKVKGGITVPNQLLRVAYLLYIRPSFTAITYGGVDAAIEYRIQVFLDFCADHIDEEGHVRRNRKNESTEGMVEAMDGVIEIILAEYLKTYQEHFA